MKYLSLFLALLVITAIGHASEFQTKSALINDQVKAIAYSGFREGQHPDRGDGAVNPSDAEIVEDLKLLEKHGFHLIRLYDSGKNSAATLRLIKQHQLPIKVLLMSPGKGTLPTRMGRRKTGDCLM